MAHFGEDLTGLILLSDVSATAADIETTLSSCKSSPDTACNICNGTCRYVCNLLHTVFSLQYQDEAACTLEFIQRCFIGINRERGTKAKRGKVVSKKKGVIVPKLSSAVNTHVAMLLKNLLDFEWNFI
ncbi:uncharacterized protein LOC109088557 [Tachysurus ichikawai]